MNRLVALYLLLFVLTGLVGAAITKRIQGGILPVWATAITSIISGVLWGLTAKESKNLSVMSALVDVIYTAAFVVGFVLLGDRLTPLQVAGFVVSMIGVAMMSV